MLYIIVGSKTGAIWKFSRMEYLFIYLSIYLKGFYLFIFRERGGKTEREGEKHQCVVASHVPSTGDLAHNTGTSPDWELNW